MATPLPGKTRTRLNTGRPIMALLDLLGRRWTLRVLWELRDGKPLNFRELQERCGGISPTVQNTRLAELRDARVIKHSPERGYRLTPDGRELVKQLSSLNGWAENWASRLEKKQ
ncbi:MAG: helix-turn-helix domain-containing protein [Rhodospirillales bacterium]